MNCCNNSYFVKKCQLLEYKRDVAHYITYVFKDLDTQDYIMCTRFPNWGSIQLNSGDIGYLKYKENIGGVTQWYDNNYNINLYNYDSIQFMTFVPELSKTENITL